MLADKVLVIEFVAIDGFSAGALVAASAAEVIEATILDIIVR